MLQLARMEIKESETHEHVDRSLGGRLEKIKDSKGGCLFFPAPKQRVGFELGFACYE